MGVVAGLEVSQLVKDNHINWQWGIRLGRNYIIIWSSEEDVNQFNIPGVGI